MGNRSVSGMRVGYTNEPLVESQMAAAPLEQFSRWFEAASAVIEPNAMVLSTSDAEGGVTSRTVLMKGIDRGGITFFTNQDSQKGRAIAAHPQVAVVFPWYALQRQVCASGRASNLARTDVEEYFHSRPRESQLGAWASRQSEVITSRDALMSAYAEASARFPAAVPVPPHWGGYLIEVDSIEFWSGQPSRLHDRLRYRRIGVGGLDEPGAWQLERLSP